jgi:hypothetical protein
VPYTPFSAAASEPPNPDTPSPRTLPPPPSELSINAMSVWTTPPASDDFLLHLLTPSAAPPPPSHQQQQQLANSLWPHIDSTTCAAFLEHLPWAPAAASAPAPAPAPAVPLPSFWGNFVAPPAVRSATLQHTLAAAAAVPSLDSLSDADTSYTAYTAETTTEAAATKAYLSIHSRMPQCSPTPAKRPRPAAPPQPVPRLTVTDEEKRADRRRRNREASSRSYYRRKQRMQGTAADLAAASARAVALHARERELRAENAGLRAQLAWRASPRLELPADFCLFAS